VLLDPVDGARANVALFERVEKACAIARYLVRLVAGSRPVAIRRVERSLASLVRALRSLAQASRALLSSRASLAARSLGVSRAMRFSRALHVCRALQSSR